MQGGRSIRIPHHRLRRPTARMVRNGRQRKQHGGGALRRIGLFHLRSASYQLRPCPHTVCAPRHLGSSTFHQVCGPKHLATTVSSAVANRKEFTYQMRCRGSLHGRVLGSHWQRTCMRTTHAWARWGLARSVSLQTKYNQIAPTYPSCASRRHGPWSCASPFPSA